MSKEIEVLEKRLSDSRVRINEAEDKWDGSKPWEEYRDYMSEYWSEYADINRELTLVKPYEMKELPSYGDLMTLKEFIDCVRGGGFIDYDGHGSYATETECSNLTVRPSDILTEKYRKDFTHVMWFNR